ncbi:Uu.00g007050.m01.CDS01 [Anthostomella pinea]|uniref:Uu.00g007050.m01.CDS01 n=1 Tax=Anthostomella pinea TaxID=933095 RepID=A0AAI8VKF3_9PEZI|nr:Uu.00g007050.m01.CDS01 [Anthostomella pinea]
MKLSLWTWLACHVASTFALSPRHPARNLKTRATAASNHTAYYFDQAIDHFPQSSRYARHSNGKFKQRYFVETSYYKAGGPVFLYLAGEGPIDGDTHLDRTDTTARPPIQIHPTDELFFTTEQVIADFDVFARKVTLPGLTDINAPSMPWILYGGSYPGALSAFTKKTAIHGQLEYPQWYDPISSSTEDCVASINDIVDNMDYLVKSNNTAAIQQLKELFGLGALKDIQINWDPTRGHIDFFDFCRNVTDGNAPANNTEADSALAANTKGQVWKNLGNYAAYIKRVVLPLCPSGDYNSGECFGTQDTAHWANTTSNYVRSYLYTTCTEFGAYQSAQPYGKKSLISRVIDAEYTQEWCNKAFPAGQYNSIPATPDLDIWNAYGDFNFTAENLLFVDGTADPWKDLCYHSDLAPQRYWSDAYPQHLINGAGHVWDLRTLVGM